MVARTIDEQFTALREAHPEVLARHWTEAGETEPAIAQWSRAGKAAEARNAFKEALESYQQALALLNLLPESPERDLRELELRQSVVRMLAVTRGYSAPETIEAIERVAALAEKSGNLAQLVHWVAFEMGHRLHLGRLTPPPVRLPTRRSSLPFAKAVPPVSRLRMHSPDTYTRHGRGDLAGVEKHFTAGLKFFDDPGFRQYPGGAVAPFGYASLNAWMLGRADVAREREARMMAAANTEQPVRGGTRQASLCRDLRLYLREYEQAEALAARALELSEKNQFPHIGSAVPDVLSVRRERSSAARPRVSN